MMVLTDPDGYAVDWDWRRGLAVWTLAGRPTEPRFDRRVLTHELPDRPPGEAAAHAAARRWWLAEGRSLASAAAGA